MCKGFIRISREILDWGWYKDSNTFRVFIHLLMNAQYKEGEFLGHTIHIGQVVTRRAELSQKLNISEQNVRTALNHLKATNEITIETTNKYSIITICKFDRWQSGFDGDNQQINQIGNQQLTNNQPTTNQQLTTYNKDNKEINKEKEKKVKRKIFDVRADLSYVNADYYPIWIEWLDYKDKIKKQYKTDVGAKKQYTHLVTLSNGDTNKAKAIVDQSIMREYEGLFDVKGYKSPAMSIDERAKEDGFPYKDEFGRHYESMFDRNLHQNSYEEYMSKKVGRR